MPLSLDAPAQGTSALQREFNRPIMRAFLAVFLAELIIIGSAVAWMQLKSRGLL